MTGYAVAVAPSPRGELGLELRSVNSRFLDVQFRITEELRSLESMLRERITARIGRGKVDCRLFLSGGTGGAAHQHTDPEVLSGLLRLADEAKRVFPDAAPLSLVEVLRWPGVIAESPVSDDALRAGVDALCNRALSELVSARGREGERLRDVILARVADMRRRIAEVAPLVPQAIAAYREKLALRLREAIGSADDERVRAEIAVFAMKVDVDEELSRLSAHLEEVARVLAAGGAVGKRLDFLAQELNREANTLASKAATQRVADCGLELKLLVEQIREQVQNIE
jgi:uncharacterized protein (TIGR00255 family)